MGKVCASALSEYYGVYVRVLDQVPPARDEKRGAERCIIELEHNKAIRYRAYCRLAARLHGRARTPTQVHIIAVSVAQTLPHLWGLYMTRSLSAMPNSHYNKK